MILSWFLVYGQGAKRTRDKRKEMMVNDFKTRNVVSTVQSQHLDVITRPNPQVRTDKKNMHSFIPPEHKRCILPSISSQSSAQCHRYEKKIVKCIHVQYKEFSSGQTVKWPGAGRARQMTAMGDGRIGILALARIHTPTTKMEPRDYWFKEKEKIEMYTHTALVPFFFSSAV